MKSISYRIDVLSKGGWATCFDYDKSVSLDDVRRIIKDLRQFDPLKTFRLVQVECVETESVLED